MYPAELRYSDNHMWVKTEGENRVRIGITYFYQRQLNKTVFVELPEEGTVVKKGEPFGSIESSKSINDLESPVSGKVTQINGKLGTNPVLTNSDPYGAGWMIEIEISNPAELNSFMSAEQYKGVVAKKAAE